MTRSVISESRICSRFAGLTSLRFCMCACCQAFLRHRGLSLETAGSFVRQAQVTKLADDNSAFFLHDMCRDRLTRTKET